MSKIEILAPAGDFEALKSAVANGADAIYFGLDIFNARIRAKNFNLENVDEAIRLCHSHGVKAYVTLNTQLYNKELPFMLDYVGELYEKGADALIVADLGCAKLIKRYYPDFEIHASTQASIHNLSGANFISSTLGYSRVVLARELDKESIRYISKNSKCETEIFVHGAHCMSVSGQCLASFCMGGRSGNRGECAQPCRLPYSIKGERGFFLSLKDMTLSNHVNELLDLGVESLKIEGRMKNEKYVGGTVDIWRRLIDEKRSASKEDTKTLCALFSRGGFTDGYFVGKINKGMLGVRSEKDKQDSKDVEEKETQIKKAKVFLKCELFIGKPSKLTLKMKDKEATVYGDVVEKAQNAPMSKADVEKNLLKFGNTPLKVEDAQIEMDEGIIIRNSSLNALRREGVEKLFASGRKKKDIDFSLSKTSCQNKKMRTAVFSREEQIPKNYDYFDIRFVYADRYTGDERVNGIALPVVILDKEWNEIELYLQKAKKNGVKYALITNIGQIDIVKRMGFTMIGDFRLNVFNSISYEYLVEQGVEGVILSPELSLSQLRDFHSCGIIAYGKFPIMTTHKCILKDTYGCEKCKGYIKDRQNVSFFAEGIFGHRNVMYNSVPIYMADKMNDIKDYSHHFIFSDEKENEAYEVIEAYKKGLCTSKGIKRIK